MTELLGQTLFEVWQELCSAIDEKYEMERLWNAVCRQYDEAKTYGDEKWVMFEPTNNDEFDDYIKLLDIKRKPNRK